MPRTNKPTDIFQHINMMNGDTNECWPWKGKINKKDGRPYFTIEGKRRPSYAIVLELYTGEQQNDRKARHSCDNPVCCNPHHLIWGSHQDNMNDMKERDRHGLPAIVVRAIQKLLAKGDTQASIAELYGVSRETISAINTGRNKEHITKEQECTYTH
jgi:hypothetical protein